MNIISKVEIVECPDWITYIVGAILCGMVAAAFIYSNISSKKKYGYIGHISSYNPLLIVGLIAIVLAFCWACFSHFFIKVPTGKYNYVAQIDDTYPINSVYENYEDITYDGTYYYFRDR